MCRTHRLLIAPPTVVLKIAFSLLGTPAFREIIARHWGENQVAGCSLVMSDCQLDRKALGALVFDHPPSRAALNRSLAAAAAADAAVVCADTGMHCCRITHARIGAKIILEILSSFVKKGGGGVVVVDAPLLFESNLHWLCDVSVVVACSDEAQQLQRCVLRDGLTLEQARSRLQRQNP
jgi:dephospho-CoA kinase